MAQFIREHQLDIMLAMSAACATVALFVLIARAIPKRRRISLLCVELSSMLLLYFDRLAYMYSGNVSRTGYIMVRLSNFLVYSLTLIVIMSINNYLIDLLITEGGVPEVPLRLRIANILSLVGVLVIVFSQFTGLYYYFDETNRYHRGPGFILCYVFPLIVPTIILTGVIKYRKNISRRVLVSVVIFIIAPMIASIVQIYAYGLSLTNMSIVSAAAVIYIVAVYDINTRIEIGNRKQIEFLNEERKDLNRLFLQTTSAFVNAIDEKDEYTRGHSVRVARYAKAIAAACGKSERECEKIYYSALLHDVGKMEMPDSVLQKGENLSPEDEEIYRQKPLIGDRILSSISDYPYLREGARYVHERYDGAGYPEHLSGDSIPEAARIIAVANRFDEITTPRAERDAFPRIIVREEFIKKAGTEFDPRFASIMAKLYDEDEALVAGQDTTVHMESETSLSCNGYRSSFTRGILVEETVTQITFSSKDTKNAEGDFSSPSLILFDSYDGRVHDDAKTIEAFRYTEYCEVWFDGRIVETNSRGKKVEVSEEDDSGYSIRIGRLDDHIRLSMHGGGRHTEVIIALADSSKYAYVSLTGEHCDISDIRIDRTAKEVSESDLSRIVPRVSYIDRMEGDIPNVQVDRTRSDYTEGIPVSDGMRVFFHGMSLPSAHLVWHCPYIVLYSSQDGKVGGEDYKEYAFIKMNGENEVEGKYHFAVNSVELEKTDEFGNWENWKEANRKGLEIELDVTRQGDTITVSTEDAGIVFTNTTRLKENVGTVYLALTGDQCALTDIRVMR